MGETVEEFLDARFQEIEEDDRDGGSVAEARARRDVVAKRAVLRSLETFHVWTQVAYEFAWVHSTHPDWQEEWTPNRVIREAGELDD